ncbi:hypothetical protein BC834DRAFT_968075 [Gloeopeniophorella convolvens]|nr:hypothetical protein BC834DRAFT_968075 [Gloeopeniophorella convolvens]
MMRRMLPRVPFLRTFVPRVSRPLLPITSRLATAETHILTGAPRSTPFRPFHTTPARLSSPSPSDGKEEPRSLSQKLKALMKAYGWYAVGVYAVVSIADFSVAFAGINLLGAEYVASAIAPVKAWFLGFVSSSRPPEPGREEIEDMSRGAGAGGQESVYAMLVLAYTLHKTIFLPVRIGVTAAFTPRLVNWLRARGWAGGEGTRRAMQEMRGRLRDRD